MVPSTSSTTRRMLFNSAGEGLRATARFYHNASRSNIYYMKSASYPVSVRLDAALMRKAAAYARRRRVGVTTALRMIIGEHLDAADAAADLDAAVRWQQERAWSTLDRWE